MSLSFPRADICESHSRMTRRIKITGYKLAKDGRRLEPCLKHLSVSDRLKRQSG